MSSTRPAALAKHKPFAPSETLAGISLTGRHANYSNADTWYPSWGADGNLYSPWTDGYIIENRHRLPWDQTHPGEACNSLDFLGRQAATAQARIEGDDPLDLRIVNLGPPVEARPEPYGGRYPCGTLVHDGVWYYGTYCVADDGECGGVGWTRLGPFVGFRTSTDAGHTWTETPWSPAQPLFGETSAPVKIGAPHFVDFGPNMERSPDGHAYLLAHGSREPSSCTNWIQADEIYLLRIRPTLDTINDPSAYQFFAGIAKDGQPRWTNQLSDAVPLLSWQGRLGSVTATLLPRLERYLMCITRGVVRGAYDTMILEAPRLVGPWRLVEYWERFGPEAYFVNIPSKFIDDDQRRLWLCYSANHSDKDREPDPPGSRYALSLHEARLLIREEHD